jgi:hypothetical protein
VNQLKRFPEIFLRITSSHASYSQDMTHFYEQYRSIKPYLMRKDDMEAGKEQLLQTMEDRAKLVGLEIEV